MGKASVLLNDDVLLSMSGRSDILQSFPWMKLKLASGGGCKCRAGAQKAQNQSEYSRVKEAIKNLPEDRKQRLKDLLKTSAIVFFINGPEGVKKYEF